MTASRPEQAPRPGIGATCAVLGFVLALGCAGAAPVGEPFAPLPTRGARAPEASDLAARDVAEAVLAGAQPAADAAVAQLDTLDRDARARGEEPSGLVPHALDARNAMLGDGPRWRHATAELLRRDDVDPALRARLERALEEDPLVVASARRRDAWRRRFGRRVNALVEPVGRSILSTALLPVRLGQALVGLVVEEHMEDELVTQERQALEQWKRFIERHPDAPQAAPLLARVERDQRRWYRTQRDRALREARSAARAGDSTRAAAFAARALRYAPEDPDAQRLGREAAEQVARRHSFEAQSLEAAPELVPGGRELAVALLRGSDVEEVARRVLDAEPRAAHADEAEFALAGAELRSGAETDSWRRLERLAERGDRHSVMARHARTLVESGEQNPYRAFRRARAAQRDDGLRVLFLGPLANGPRDRDWPRAVEWLIEIPTLIPVVTGFPMRLLRYPWLSNPRRSPGVFASHYLESFPDGEHAPAVREWLVGYERGRGNYVGALQVAQGTGPDADPKRLEELRERAAEQALAASQREQRLDARVALLARTSQQFEGTRAGTDAGSELRREIESASAQRIRLSRGFLVENPELVGPEALALHPGLLDHDLSNGELHPDGIAILGGRQLEICFVDASGNDRRKPECVRDEVSPERVSRLVTLLQETSLENELLDPDDRVAPDAPRDVFFERARLGITDASAPRAAARSSYAYRGMRERYGLVRSRESILPVELVIQGSFLDFGLGAFPRVRLPKPTPDAFLYE